MAVVNADKIFVDINDEINFIVEKFNQSQADRVVLVCPQNSLIISSSISIKILVKQLLHSKKQLILITEDSYGRNVAESAGIVVGNRVSEISKQMWDLAAQRKEHEQAKLEERKNQLLADRGIIEKEPKFHDQNEIHVEMEISEVESEPEQVDIPTEESVEEVEVTPEQELENGAMIDAPKTEDEVVGPIQRKRREPKMVKLGNLEIVAAGDISNFDKEVKKNMSEQNKDLKPGSREVDTEITPFKGGFTGRDWTKYTNDEKPSFMQKLANLNPFRKTNFRTEEDKLKHKKRQQIFIGSIATIVLIIFVVMYLIIFEFSNVDINITKKQADIPIEQVITVDLDASVVDTENLVVPAIEVSPYEVSGSLSADATGSFQRGEKSSGLIELWNKKPEEVVLEAGTVITEISGDINFRLVDSVELPAAQVDDDNGTVDTLGIVEDVTVEAVDIGPEFNITVPDSDTLEFVVAGFTEDEMVGKGFTDIDGGSREEFTGVKQEDVDSAKETLKNRLLNNGIDGLRGTIEDGLILITGTEKLIESSVTANPDVGEEASGFALSVEGQVTMFAVTEEDLQAAIEALIAKSQEDAFAFEVTNVSNAQFTEVNRGDNKATFILASEGSVTSELDLDALKGQVAGKSVNEAREILSGVEEIESFRVSFNPGYIPDSWQFVPRNTNRISIDAR